MSDIEIDPAVGRLVTAWLNKHDSEPNSNQVPAEVLDFTPRPARLGLGAKYIPHKPNMSEADRRLAGSLRKQKRDEQRERTDAADHNDEVDSRAAMVVKKKRGRGRPRKHPLPPAQATTPIVTNAKQVSTPGLPKESDDDFGRPEQKAGDGGGGADDGRGDAPVVGFKKRKKIRSRQKNLKRDNRPKDQLPSHLTEHTLRGGRVHKDVPNGNVP